MEIAVGDRNRGLRLRAPWRIPRGRVRNFAVSYLIFLPWSLIELTEKACVLKHGREWQTSKLLICNSHETEKGRVDWIFIAVFAMSQNMLVIFRSSKCNLSKLIILYWLNRDEPRPANADKAGGKSWALWTIRWLRRIETWTLSIFRSILWFATGSWRWTIKMGSRSGCGVMVSWSAVFLMDVTRLVERLLSSVDDIAGDCRREDCRLGVAIFSPSIVRRTQWVQSTSESLRLRARTVRSLGLMAKTMARRGMNLFQLKTKQVKEANSNRWNSQDIYLCSNCYFIFLFLVSRSLAGWEHYVEARQAVCQFSTCRRMLLNRKRKKNHAVCPILGQSFPVGKHWRGRCVRVVHCQRRNGKRSCPKVMKSAAQRCCFFCTETGLFRKRSCGTE